MPTTLAPRSLTKLITIRLATSLRCRLAASSPSRSVMLLFQLGNILKHKQIKDKHKLRIMFVTLIFLGGRGCVAPPLVEASAPRFAAIVPVWPPRRPTGLLNRALRSLFLSLPALAARVVLGWIVARAGTCQPTSRCGLRSRRPGTRCTNRPGTRAGTSRARSRHTATGSGYVDFRLILHHFDHFELNLRGHIHVRGAALSCLRLKSADIVLI